VLVRTGSGMEPTARALELAAPVNELLRDVQRALAPPQAFDPTISTQRFRIESADEVELSLLPRLVPRLARDAPGVELSLSRVTLAVEEQLRTGRADVYLGTWFKIPAQLQRHLLLQETFACIARRGHPRPHEQPPHRWLRGVIMDAAMNET